MGKTKQSLFNRCHKFIKPLFSIRRKQWIKAITSDVLKASPSESIIFKHSIPTDKLIVSKILSDNTLTNLSVQACYVYTSTEKQSLFKNDFPMCQYIKEDFICFAEKFILPNIHFYITIFDERIISFISTLYNDLWRLILQLFISTPILDQYENNLKTLNRVYLDDKDYFIIERLLPHKIMTKYNIYNILSHTLETINNLYDSDLESNLNLLSDIAISIYLEPLKRPADITCTHFHESTKNIPTYLSVRFYIPRSFITVHDVHVSDIESHTITLLGERAKLFK